MKIKNRILALLLLVTVALFTLASCAEGNVASSGTATIVIERADDDYAVYEVDLSELEKRDEGAISVLEYIASREESTLFYSVQWGGGYGAYITEIDSLSPNPANQYIAIYTSEEADFAVPSYASSAVLTVSYGGIYLSYSGVGLSSMHINDGTVVLFRLEEF